jgi:NAD+ diphosphatase
VVARWWVFAGRAVLLRRGWASTDEPGVGDGDPRPGAPLASGSTYRFDSVWLSGDSGLAVIESPEAGDADGAPEGRTGLGEPAQTLVDGPPPPAPEGYEWVDLRRAASAMAPDVFHRAGRAWQLLEWRRTHRFCGVCGAPTAVGPYDALACTRCDHLHFPRLSPAVIVLVHDGDRALLGRGPHLPDGMYSTLAGFVEPGESLEAAVHREILEEADVRIDDLRYMGSQPWPFPHSLMIGFTARWVSGTPRPADGELEDVGWFHRDALPRIPGPVSIARALIDAWLRSEPG